MSALQIAFGGAARGVLDRLGEPRAGYARMLSLHDLAPFDNAPQLENLINAWVPVAGGGVRPADFLELIRRWGQGPHAMEVAELIAVPGQLAPLRPDEAHSLLAQFLARPEAIPRAQVVRKVAGIVGTQCGDMNMDSRQFLALCTHLCATLTVDEVVDVLSRITLSTAARTILIHRTLCHEGAGSLDGRQFRQVVRWWRAVDQGGAGAMNSEEMETFCTQLRPGALPVPVVPVPAIPVPAAPVPAAPVPAAPVPAAPVPAAPVPAAPLVLTGAQIREITKWYVSDGNGNPRMMTLLITRLLRHRVGAQEIYDLLNAMLGNNAIRRVAWLKDAYEHPDNATFGDCVRAAITAADANSVGVLLGEMSDNGIPHSRATFVLGLFPTVTGNRFQRFRRFLAGAYVARGTGIEHAVIAPLERFVLAGRAPFGLNSPFPARLDGNDGPVVCHLRPAGDLEIRLHERGMEHAQNAHTYAHCDFRDRLARVGVRHIDFWPRDCDRARIQAKLTGLTPHQVTPIANAAGQRGGDGYSAEIHGQIGIGLAPRPRGAGNMRIFAVTHLAPFGGESVSMLALRAISCLFDPAP